MGTSAEVQMFISCVMSLVRHYTQTHHQKQNPNPAQLLGVIKYTLISSVSVGTGTCRSSFIRSISIINTHCYRLRHTHTHIFPLLFLISLQHHKRLNDLVFCFFFYLLKFFLPKLIINYIYSCDILLLNITQKQTNQSPGVS